jgi:hypothetical protein
VRALQLLTYGDGLSARVFLSDSPGLFCSEASEAMSILRPTIRNTYQASYIEDVPSESKLLVSTLGEDAQAREHRPVVCSVDCAVLAVARTSMGLVDPFSC